MKAAELLVRCLENENVDYIFGYSTHDQADDLAFFSEHRAPGISRRCGRTDLDLPGPIKHTACGHQPIRHGSRQGGGLWEHL